MKCCEIKSWTESLSVAPQNALLGFLKNFLSTPDFYFGPNMGGGVVRLMHYDIIYFLQRYILL